MVLCCVAVLSCLLSYLVSEDPALRGGAVRALHSSLQLHSARDDCITRLLSRITRGKSQAGIIADASYASHVSAVTPLLAIQFV